MVSTYGNASTGSSYSDATAVDLPRPAAGVRPAHRPWCVDCKRKDRALDDDQLCEQCAHAAVTRAAQRARWAEADQAERAKPAETPKPKRAAKQTGRPGHRKIELPVAEICDRWMAGEPIAVLAAEFKVARGTIAKRLSAAGLTERPRGGGTTRIDRTPELVEAVQRLYVGEVRSTTEIAAMLGRPATLVAQLVSEFVSDATTPDSLTALGVTSRDVKQWAVTAGLMPAVVRGRVRRDVLEAYATAHRSAVDPEGASA